MCQVDGLGEFEAAVRVTDGRGGKSTGFGKARGVNDPPRLFIGFPTTAGPGECHVKVTFRDRWGAVGVASGTYPVAP